MNLLFIDRFITVIGRPRASCRFELRALGLVGQDGILRRVGNPPSMDGPHRKWPVANRPQVDNLPHKTTDDLDERSPSQDCDDQSR